MNTRVNFFMVRMWPTNSSLSPYFFDDFISHFPIFNKHNIKKLQGPGNAYTETEIKLKFSIPPTLLIHFWNFIRYFAYKSSSKAKWITAQNKNITRHNEIEKKQSSMIKKQHFFMNDVVRSDLCTVLEVVK